MVDFLHRLPAQTPTVLAVQKDIQKSYADIRGAAMAAYINARAQKLIDNSKTSQFGMQPPSFEYIISSIFDGVKVNMLLCIGGRENDSYLVTKIELALALQFFPPFTTNYIFRCLVSNPLSTFLEAGQQINNNVKRNLTATISIAFESFSALTSRQDAFEETIRQKTSRKENEFGDLIHAFRATCMRSLPEFLEELNVRIINLLRSLSF